MRVPACSRLTAPCRAYSLIELLAVVAIISALAGLTVGSLSPVKANALTTGGNKIADLLTLARQNSLSRHAFTAVIIKTTEEARYSAYCLFELTQNDDGTFSDWKMTAPWRLLPDGIRFDPRSVAGPANFLDMGSPPSSPRTLPAAIPFRGNLIPVGTGAAYQIFASDGRLTKGDPVRLRLVEAGEATGPGLVYTGQHSADQPLNYYDIVLVGETGQAKVERF